jgi:hypothetical protein
MLPNAAIKVPSVLSAFTFYSLRSSHGSAKPEGWFFGHLDDARRVKVLSPHLPGSPTAGPSEVRTYSPPLIC